MAALVIGHENLVDLLVAFASLPILLVNLGRECPFPTQGT
jgi:hypothetical protein